MVGQGLGLLHQAGAVLGRRGEARQELGVLAAAEMLNHRGFGQVSSLAGGIAAWQGLTAPGTAAQGMGLVTWQEDRARLLIIALGLEAGLGEFYRQASERAVGQAAASLCQRLALVEQRHRDQVYDLHRREKPDAPGQEGLLEQAQATVMKGGEQV